MPRFPNLLRSRIHLVRPPSLPVSPQPLLLSLRPRRPRSRPAMCPDSFCGHFMSSKKLIICATAFRSRHRDLPYRLDRAILLPNERLSMLHRLCNFSTRSFLHRFRYHISIKSRHLNVQVRNHKCKTSNQHSSQHKQIPSPKKPPTPS